MRSITTANPQQSASRRYLARNDPRTSRDDLEELELVPSVPSAPNSLWHQERHLRHDSKGRNPFERTHSHTMRPTFKRNGLRDARRGWIAENTTAKVSYLDNEITCRPCAKRVNDKGHPFNALYSGENQSRSFARRNTLLLQLRCRASVNQPATIKRNKPSNEHKGELSRQGFLENATKHVYEYYYYILAGLEMPREEEVWTADFTSTSTPNCHTRLSLNEAARAA